MAKKKGKVKTHNAMLADAIKITKTKRKNGNGFLICDKAVIAREGVMTYHEYELPFSIMEELGWPPTVNVFRTFDVLTEHFEDFEGLPFTDGHHYDPITVKDKERIAGIATTVKKKAPNVEASLTVFDINAVFDIEQGEKVELSLGYGTELKIQDGVHEGVPYQVVQTMVQPNHIALTRAGRCGPECSIGDSKGTVHDCGCTTCTNRARKGKTTSTQTKGNDTMEKECIAISLNGKVVYVADESVPLVNAMQDALDTATATIATKEGELATAQTALKDEQGKYTPEKILAMVNDQASERTAILTKAKAVLGDEDISKLDNAAIKRKVLEAKGVPVADDAGFIDGAFAALAVDTKDTTTKGNNGAAFTQDSPASLKDGDYTDDGLSIIVDGKPMDRVQAARLGHTARVRKSA